MPRPRIMKRSAAYEDLRDHAMHLASAAGPRVAIRFLEAVEKDFKNLAGMPGLGRPRHFNHPELGFLRSWRVSGFERYLIFYRELENGVEIIRVLHGMRDLTQILEDEP